MNGYIHKLEVDLKMAPEADETVNRSQVDKCYDTLFGPVIDEVITKYSLKYDIDIDKLEIDLGRIPSQDVPYTLRTKLEDELDKRISHEAVLQAEAGLEVETRSYALTYQEADARRMIEASETETIAGTEVEAESESELVAEPESVAEANSKTMSGSEVGSSLKIETDNKAEKDSFVEADPITETDIKAGSGSKAETDSTTVVYSKAKASSKDITVSKGNTAIESKDRTKAVSLTEGEAEASSTVYPGSDNGLSEQRTFSTTLKNIPGAVGKQEPFAASVLLDYIDSESIPWFISQDDFSPDNLVINNIEELLSNDLFIASVFQKENRLLRFLDLLNPESFKALLSFIPSYIDKGIIDLEAASFGGVQVIGGPSEATEALAQLYQALSQGYIPDTIRDKESDNYSEALSERLGTSSSGLVLFHPFLVSFFQKLGLVGQDRQFKGKQARIKAIHILHHIAFPSSKHNPHSMHLEKVLCGLTPDAFVPRKWETDGDTEQEIKSLMEAVCEYWKPLNKTSAEGFRNSFIRREGLLSLEDDTWVLRVEETAIDILLRDLPWEISTILLPWSKRILLVDWQVNF